MVKKYHWYEILQYISFLLMAATLPMGWRYALWAALFAAFVSAVKLVAQRRVGNPALTAPMRWALLAPVFYWGFLAISMLWSSDWATGWIVLRLKAVLLIFPLCLLLTDTSYLCPRHIRGIGYALLLSVLAIFFWFSLQAGIKVAEGSTIAEVTGSRFDPRHHAYTAFYATAAIVFLYHELSTRWGTLRRWHRGLLIAATPLLVCYIVLVNSRAGLLSLGLACAACVAHLAYVQRSLKMGVGVGALVAATVAAALLLLPGYVNRFASSIDEVENDTRSYILRSSCHAYVESPLIGYGVGDYHDRQVQQYNADEFEDGQEHHFNAHNQYLETLLADGIPGLISLLFMLVAPLVVALHANRRYSFLVALFMALVMLNFLFESMLERQMGLLFIGPLFATMVLILSVEKNKFAQ